MRITFSQSALAALAVAGPSWAVLDDDAEAIKGIPPEWQSAYKSGQILPYSDTPGTQPIAVSPLTLSRSSSISLPLGSSWGSDAMAPSSVSSACSYPPRHSGELEPVKKDVFDTYVASDDARSTTIRHYMKHAVQVPSQALQAAKAIADTVYFKAQSPAAQKTTRTKALGYFYNSLQEIIKGLWSEDEYGVFEDATRQLVHRASKATGFALWIYRPEPKKAPLLESCLLAEPFKGCNRVQLDRMSAHFYHSVALPFSSDAEAMAIREYVTAVAIPAYNAHVMCLINSAAYHHN